MPVIAEGTEDAPTVLHVAVNLHGFREGIVLGDAEQFYGFQIAV